MIEFPEKLENLLLTYIKREFYRGTRREVFAERPFGVEDLRFFAKGVSRLSDLFTTERGEIDSHYLKQPEMRAGYLLYFLPINFGKTCFVLQQLPETFWQREHYRILDLGAGPGSASFATATSFAEKNPKAKLDWVWLDQNERILQDGARIFEAYLGSANRPRILNGNLKRARFNERFDLILMSHTLNEWGPGAIEAKSDWLKSLLETSLAPNGYVVLLEPALKRPTRDLMSLRNAMLEASAFVALAPCGHERSCPMLEQSKGDWCHFYVDWHEPEYLRRLDQLVGNENRFLKVAYLILQAQNATRVIDADLFRVVSNRMATRGKTELVLCGPSGYLQLSRLDRDSSPSNASLDKVRRGDLVRLDVKKELQESGRLRLGKGDGLKIVRSA